MAEYKGTKADASRVSKLQAERMRQLEDLERAKESLNASSSVAVGSISSKFAAQQHHADSRLKNVTIGLLTNEEFRRKQQSIELEEVKRLQEEIERQKQKQSIKKRRREAQRNKLSFDLEEEEETSDLRKLTSSSSSSTSSSPSSSSSAALPVDPVAPDSEGTNVQGDPESKEKQETGEETGELLMDGEPERKRRNILMSNPDVDASFLPDQEREERVRDEIVRLQREYLEEQEKIKQELIPVTYSYWDGSGHRRTSIVKKGITMSKFLEVVRQEFTRELRAVGVDDLIFVKEDLIIPHNVSFYDLMISKARGKSGPLFHFDVHDDIRLLSDAQKEKEESHAAKVVERRWYEKNKHQFPMNRWEVYDPKTQRDIPYTISDKSK